MGESIESVFKCSFRCVLIFEVRSDLEWRYFRLFFAWQALECARCVSQFTLQVHEELLGSAIFKRYDEVQELLWNTKTSMGNGIKKCFQQYVYILFFAFFSRSPKSSSFFCLTSQNSGLHRIQSSNLGFLDANHMASGFLHFLLNDGGLLVTHGTEMVWLLVLFPTLGWHASYQNVKNVLSHSITGMVYLPTFTININYSCSR